MGVFRFGMKKFNTLGFRKLRKYNGWWKLFSIFRVAWAFGDTFSLNEQQLLWENMVKALLADLWFNQP